MGRASRTQETGGENVRGQRSDLGFKVPSCEVIGFLRVWGFRVQGLWIRALGLGV